jgi:hypothetical protein
MSEIPAPYRLDSNVLVVCFPVKPLTTYSPPPPYQSAESKQELADVVPWHTGGTLGRKYRQK